MDWWNFKDIPFLSFFISINVLLLLLIIFLISLSISDSKDKKYREKIKQESNTTRIFVIDVRKNIVTYFNRSSLKNKREMDMIQFYHRFHPSDVEKVKNWIFSICIDSKNCEPYLEADIVINRGKNSYFSLLKLLNYDSEKGFLNLESHILRYITPSHLPSKKKNNHVTKKFAGVVPSSVMKNLIVNSKSIKGFTFCIKFFYMKQKALANEKVERYMAMTLRNEIYPFASNSKSPRQIVEVNDNEMYLFDLFLSSKDDAMHLANSISHALKKTIEVNGFVSSITFSIGVIQNSLFYQDYDEIISHVCETAISAHQNDSLVLLYYKSIAASNVELLRYNDEINQLMEPGSLRYLYRPIINVSKKKITGYFSYIKAYDSSFTSFLEMSKYAYKVNRNKELFTKVAKNVIPKFANEKPDNKCKLFFSVSLLDLDEMKEILPHIPRIKDVNLVLVFDEQEVNQNAVKVELINEQMKIIHDLSYSIALSLKDKNLLLDPSIYTNFDYFVVGAAMTEEIKKNNRIRLSIHTLIEQLLKYKKPIIATDLESWQSIELIIKSGINYVSSEAISINNDMLLPIEKKKMDKLSQMGDNYKF
ncbi:MAG: EAL domain-containing protein [Bacilli bacterium]